VAIRKVAAAAFICAVFSVASPVWAAGLNYSYADAGYYRSSGDPVNLDGVLVDASFGVFDLMALRAGFIRAATVNIPNDSPDLTEFRVGMRLHYTLVKNLDLFGDVLGFNAKLNGNKSTSTDIGIIYEAGVRYLLHKRFEANASYKRIGGDLNKDFGTVGAVFKMTKAFSLSAKAEVNSDVQNYFAGIRFNF
jgi:hypothetical protein